MEQTLGKRIVHHRKRLGLTQDQLAEKLGVTAQAVSKWENDQSCPDITMLPRLAEIFGTTTDVLLGHQGPLPVYEAEVVNDDTDGVHAQVGGWEFTWDSGRKNALGFAVLVLAVGVLMLLSNILTWDVSFWNILWPTTLLVFGLFGLFPKFSFFRFGCLLFGGYFLLDSLGFLPFILGGNVIFPALVILFGLSLFADAIKKPAKSSFKFKNKGKSNKTKNDYSIDGDRFCFSASFGESEQFVEMPRLSSGEISVSFGDYTVDLSGVEAVSADCCVEANCSFGELTVLVPRCYHAQPSSSTSFAEIHTKGQPDNDPKGIIRIDANASFGEICIKYV